MNQKLLTTAILAVVFGYPAVYVFNESRGSPPGDSPKAESPLVPDEVQENEPFEAKIGQLITLTFPLKNVAWTVEPEIVDIAVVSDDTCVLSFRTPGRYVVIAAGRSDDGKVSIQRTVVEVE